MLACLAVVPTLAYGQNFNLSPTFAGQAVALQVNQLGADPVALADTGPAPALGGQRENYLRDTPPIPGVAAHLLYAVTLGAGSRNRSQASLSVLDMTLGVHHVTALWVESEATATSEFLGVLTSGKSTLGGLTVDGQLVTVTGEPNQIINFPDGYLVINEQSGSSSRNFGTLTVNALHLLVDGAGSIIAGSATAEVINGPTPNLVP
jgi:hypothetical protein